MSTCAQKPTSPGGTKPDPDPTSTTPGLSKDCWTNAFGTFDRDGDGVITANDLNGKSRSKGEGVFRFFGGGKKQNLLTKKKMGCLFRVCIVKGQGVLTRNDPLLFDNE